MEVTEIVVETALRAMLYSMEAEMGRDAAKATPEYQRMDRRLADLEAKHIEEMSILLGLGRRP